MIKVSQSRKHPNLRLKQWVPQDAKTLIASTRLGCHFVRPINGQASQNPNQFQLSQDVVR